MTVDEWQRFAIEGSRVACPICKASVDADTLGIHVVENHSNGLCECPICGEHFSDDGVFRGKRRLAHHIWTTRHMTDQEHQLLAALRRIG